MFVKPAAVNQKHANDKLADMIVPFLGKSNLSAVLSSTCLRVASHVPPRHSITRTTHSDSEECLALFFKACAPQHSQPSNTRPNEMLAMCSHNAKHAAPVLFFSALLSSLWFQIKASFKRLFMAFPVWEGKVP